MGELDRVAQVPGGLHRRRSRGGDIRRAGKPVGGLLPDPAIDGRRSAMTADERGRLPVVVRDELSESVLSAFGARLEPCRRAAVQACALGPRQSLVRHLPDQDVTKGHTILTGMTDEIFHLTPLDVRRYEFGRVMRGYDPERVDQFREQVADELERLTRLNQELEQKARGFHDQLKSFRERDKALNEALVSAQQLRAEMRDQSERESQLVLREAQAQAEGILANAQSDIRRAEDELAALDRFRRNYLTQLRVFVERQLAEITAAEAAPTIQRTRTE